MFSRYFHPKFEERCGTGRFGTGILFFVPVIPYSKEHIIYCPICGNGERLDSREFAELLATIENTGDTQGADNYDPELVGKTETQINYIKTMREFEARKNAGK